MFRQSGISSAVIAMTLGLAACGGNGSSGSGSAGISAAGAGSASAAAPVAGDTVALTASSRLVSFNRAAPGQLLSTSPVISGLQANETLLGIDYRPANGLLYGAGSSNAVYQLDPATGVASNRVALSDAAAGNAAIVLTGTGFGVDFNPQADRLRIVSNTGQNLRVNLAAATGNTAVDTPVLAAASVSASAYSNSFSGAVKTNLYSINLASATLDEQGTLNTATGTTSPNDGTQRTIAPLGVAPGAVNGFDIDGRNNMGYAAFTIGAATTLYAINLTPAAQANAATVVGPIGSGTESIRGIALAPVAAPLVTALTDNNALVTFSPKAPNALLGNVQITGLNAPAGNPPVQEKILGMDYRPQDGMLWALSNAGRLYTVVPATGAATFRATLTADATDTTAPYTAATLGEATSLSVDFNPVANRLRVISDSGLNLRIAVVDIPATATTAAVPAGATTTDGVINRADASASSVLAAAYTNSFAGATSTALYNLDGTADYLTLQTPPNNGTLVNQGTTGLGLDISNLAGFDIAGGDNGLILGAVRANDSGPFLLRTINLLTGQVSTYNPVSTGTVPTDAQSQIGGAGLVIRDIAINPL